jgi:hypothetical protein
MKKVMPLGGGEKKEPFERMGERENKRSPSSL